jgi:hypothetical protein
LAVWKPKPPNRGWAPTPSERLRARFYEYALGSARESRDWYYRGRHILGDDVAGHRLQLLTEIIRLLLTMVPQQRGRTLREGEIPYHTDPDTDKLDNLLTNILLP